MLKERLKFLLKDAALYGLVNGLSRFVVFLTIPLIVKEIDVGEFGIWNLLTILGSTVSAVLIFGMDSAVVRYYYDSDNFSHRQKIFSHGFYIQLALITLCCLPALFLPAFLLKTLGVNPAFTGALFIIFSWIPANIFTQYFQNWFKWTFQRTRFLGIAVGTAATNLIILFFCIQSKGLNLNSVLAIQALSVWIYTLLGLWWCRNLFVFRIDKALTSRLLSYGFPMMMIMVISVLSPAIDRLFLAHHLDENQLGIYSFIQKISVIMTVVVAAFQTAFGPFSFSIWQNADAAQTFSRFQSYYLMAAGVIAILICCLSQPLTLLLGTAEYLGDQKYLPILILGSLVYGLYSFSAIGIYHSKKMSRNLLALSGGLLTMVAVNVFLVPIYKEYGAAFAFLTGNIVMVLTAFWLSQQYYRIPFSYFKDAISFVALMVLMGATTIPFKENLYLDAAYKALSLVPLFMIVCFALFTNNEKRLLLRLVKKLS